MRRAPELQGSPVCYRGLRESCLKMGVEFSPADDGDHQIVRGEKVTDECDDII